VSLPPTEATTSEPVRLPEHTPEHTPASRLLLVRARFLAEASRLLAQSLDYEATLATVATLATPEFGAWCLVDVVEADGAIRRLAVVHPDRGSRRSRASSSAATRRRWRTRSAPPSCSEPGRRSSSRR
jgi:hypothetical protein